MTLTLHQALEILRNQLTLRTLPQIIETVPLENALGRVLAEEQRADRDYPPFPRSARDGYAVRARDVARVPSTLRCIGESRAGGFFPRGVQPGECVSIMTGAPVPDGADSVVMVEHTQAEGPSVTFHKAAVPLDNIVPRGSEAAIGAVLLKPGRRIDAGVAGLLAAMGSTNVRVFRTPEVAILPTGDELVPPAATPEWFQVRNSNSYSLAAQTTIAGGSPRVLAIARDDPGELSSLILEGLESDLLLLSGGVSAGKYDFVENVLSSLGAEIYFESVAIRPGKPVVFGRVKEKFFFGLPGNPISTYVTFELFVHPAIAALGGAGFEEPLLFAAQLAKPVKRKEGLTAFIPSLVSRGDRHPTVEPVPWQGSGDVAGFAAANCFLVVYPDRQPPAAGDWVDVMPITR